MALAGVFRHMAKPYDALLVVSFGGPERSDDVMPFLENIVRGKDVPAERLAEVAEHYELFDGVSPLPGEIRAMLAALADLLRAEGPDLTIYWGNRFWHPLLGDIVRQMAEEGVGRALAFCTSAYGSLPGCREYRDAIARAVEEAGPAAPQIDKLRLFYNHPGFIEPQVERAVAAFDRVPADRRADARLVFTAHSLPAAMSERAPYERQLRASCRLTAERLGRARWDLVFQSRSGPPSQPWLEPDVRQYLFDLGRSGDAADVVLVPIGFVCEHMEVVYDLDVEAAAVCEATGLNLVRAGTVGPHPRFVRMIRELILERLDPDAPRPALGDDGPAPDDCADDCCRPLA